MAMPETQPSRQEEALTDVFFKATLDAPEDFVIPNPDLSKRCLLVAKSTFDRANRLRQFGPLEKLLTEEEGFGDLEQIWELMQIRNKPVLQYVKRTLRRLEKYMEQAHSSEDEQDDSDEDYTAAEESGRDDKMELEHEYGLEIKDRAGNIAKNEDTASDLESPIEEYDNEEDEDDSDEDEERNYKPSAVDDEFFSLTEMEKFVNEAEEIEERDQEILSGRYPTSLEKKRQGTSKVGEEEDTSESEEEGHDDEIDFFKDPDEMGDSEDEDTKDASELMYDDFFKPPTRLSKRAAAKESRERAVKRVYEEAKKAQREAKKQRKLGDGESESDESEDDEEQEEDASTAGPRDLFAEGDSDDETSAKGKAGKSEFEIQQGNLRKRIEKMEDEIIEKKEWTMKGEVTSKARPLNSLLEEDLTFDYVQKPTPQVTQESTETLEAMIKRRILEESWDDVERKREVEPKVFKPSERVDLDDSKPQQSLAEAYESEYLKQQAGDSYVHPSDEKLDKQHQEIDAMFRTLCVKLDALSNFHFTPKPAQPDVVIRAEAPAIEMEEVVPVNQSTALQLAPEEIYEKPVESGYTGDVKGKSERDATDRRRIKAKRKQEFKKKQKEKEATRKAKESVSSSIKVQSS